MDSSLPQSHVCISNPLPDTHNPSPCDLYQRMIKQERMVMECERRSDSRNLIRRGWARVKSALVKWEEGFKEKREARRLSETSLDSPLARLTCDSSSTSHLTHPPTSSTTLTSAFTEPMAQIESCSIIRIVSHSSLSRPTRVGTSVAEVQHSSPPLSSPLMSSSASRTRTRSGTITTIAESSTTATLDDEMPRPIPNVQVKMFRRVSMVDGEEDFEEIIRRAGERRVDFVWGKGVDDFIPSFEAEEQEGKKGWRKLSKG